MMTGAPSFVRLLISQSGRHGDHLDCVSTLPRGTRPVAGDASAWLSAAVLLLLFAISTRMPTVMTMATRAWTTSHHGISVEIAKSNNNTAALSQAEASPATGRMPTRQS